MLMATVSCQTRKYAQNWQSAIQKFGKKRKRLRRIKVFARVKTSVYLIRLELRAKRVGSATLSYFREKHGQF